MEKEIENRLVQLRGHVDVLTRIELAEQHAKHMDDLHGHLERLLDLQGDSQRMLGNQMLVNKVMVQTIKELRQGIIFIAEEVGECKKRLSAIENQ